MLDLLATAQFILKLVGGPIIDYLDEIKQKEYQSPQLLTSLKRLRLGVARNWTSNSLALYPPLLST